MLNPKYTSPFTKDIYAAIEREIERLERLEFSDQHENARKLARLIRWRSYLEADHAVVEMEITKFPPDGPINL